jgi:putative membrane protein insertion efficiency factor
MKQLIFIAIAIYQIVISPVFKQLLGVKSQCRYSPSCSHYAKQVIEEYGVLKGTKLATQRLLRCQPFAKSYGTI